jgi:hypothetical protein
MKGASLGKAQALPANIKLGWKGLPDKHFSLFRKPVKSFVVQPIFELSLQRALLSLAVSV